MNRIALAFLLLAPVWVLPRAECSAFTLAGKYLAARFAADCRALGITLTDIYRAVLAVGEDVRPVCGMWLNRGFTSSGNYKTKIPAGVTFHFGDGSCQLGVASRDMITFIKENQPTASLSAGFLRFRW